MKLLTALIGLGCIALSYGYPQSDSSQEFTRQAQSTIRYRNPFLPVVPAACDEHSSNVALTTTPTSGPRNLFLPVLPSHPVEKKSTAPPRTTTLSVSRNPFLPIIPPPSINIITEAPWRTSVPEVSERLDTCQGPDRRQGVCTPLINCDPLLRRLQNDPTNSDLKTFLRQSNQICGNKYAVVCCPLSLISQNVAMRLPTVEEGCGYKKKPSGNELRIFVVGGTDSGLGQWPWIALLGYNDETSGSPFKCGGALITSRHVLTAAHCIRSDLSFVRLGEHDLSTDTEAKHIDVPVSKTLRHPQYNRLDGHNDIALLYLNRNVKFSEQIAPICLPLTPELRTKSYINDLPVVAGWGRTMEDGQTATVLQQLKISVFNNSVCADSYRKQNRFLSQQQFDDAVICAGDLNGGKDTCQGDSGGPLMISERINDNEHFFLIGVVSYGIGCARPEIPGVYSRVGNFIDWIQSAIANTS